MLETETNDPEQTAQTSPPSDTIGSSENTATNSDADSTTEAFDAESLELYHGLPPGSFKDVTSADEALAAIRDMTDKTLLAGLGLGQNPGVASSETTTTAKPVTKAVEKKDGPAAQPTGNADYDKLRAELDEVKGTLAAQRTNQQQMILAEIDRRFVAEVDSWASAKYGVTGSRNYKQTKAVEELRDELIPNFVNGASGLGRAIPTIEIVARNIRVHVDDTYKPGAKKEDKSAALGTPGSRRESNDSKAPRNIHEALQRNAS